MIVKAFENCFFQVGTLHKTLPVFMLFERRLPGWRNWSCRQRIPRDDPSTRAASFVDFAKYVAAFAQPIEEQTAQPQSSHPRGKDEAKVNSIIQLE